MEHPLTAPVASARSTSPRVLIVEDDRHLANVVERYLSHEGFGVEVVHDGEAGGTVTATARSDGRGLRLVIGDECGGIPTEDLHRIFDVAFRGDLARSRDTGGGGLGLAIARGLLEARAGRISVRNRRGGCEFTVHVPAAVQP